MGKHLETALYILVALAVVFSLANTAIVLDKSAKARAVVRQAELDAQPANIDLTIITAASCKTCFDIAPVIDSLKKANVKITSEKAIDASSAEAKQLIEKYGISRLPTIMVSGELGKPSVKSFFSNGWQVSIDTAVYSAVLPPYADVAGNIKGLVSLTQISDESCSKCADMSLVINFFRQAGVKFSTEKEADYKTSEAQELIAKFGVDRVPAIIVSKDVLEYSAVAEVWPQLGATEKENMFALHTTSPPYRDLAENKIVGLTKVVYLSDKSCATCYDVSINKNILAGLGVTIADESRIDIADAEGKGYLEKYSIIKVPIIILSPEASAYSRFVAAWKQVGDIASDDWYVMRNPNVLGTYKDLTTGQVVAPQARAASSDNGQ